MHFCFYFLFHFFTLFYFENLIVMLSLVSFQTFSHHHRHHLTCFESLELSPPNPLKTFVICSLTISSIFKFSFALSATSRSATPLNTTAGTPAISFIATADSFCDISVKCLPVSPSMQLRMFASFK
jgi:hypothetical protein